MLKYKDFTWAMKAVHAVNKQYGPLSPMDLANHTLHIFHDIDRQQVDYAISNLQVEGYLKLDFSSGRYYSSTPAEDSSEEFTGSIEFDVQI